VTAVLLADDHPLLLRGLKDLVSAQRDFHVCATASDGEQALALIRDRRPDIAVLDLAMPGMDGLEILKLLSHESFEARVIFLTASIGHEQIVDAIAAGAWGILLKESAPEDLIECLAHIASGKKWLPSELVAPAVARQATLSASKNKLSLLTRREHEVVQLVCEGLPNKLVARRLAMSEGTVRVHLHTIYAKLGVVNRTELTALRFSALR
jgi:DNA-binding NarL/FixJ family response regulator